MKIRFTQIPAGLPYPIKYYAELSTLHSDVIDYVSEHFENKLSFKRKVVQVLNTLTYKVLGDEIIPGTWTANNPFDNIDLVDDSELKSTLEDMYIDTKLIDWDIEEAADITSADNDVKSSEKSSFKAIESKIYEDELRKVSTSADTISPNMGLTPKESLYLAPPIVPRFDYKKPWLSGTVGGTQLAIYTSLPEIPTMQRQISVTTDYTKLTDDDVMNLYPNTFIRTRAAIMYEPVKDLEFHNKLGVILPIRGFTKKQIVDNIVKYPHLFRLKRLVNDEFVTFYENIEIDGELHNTVEIWDNLKDSRSMPKNPEYMKEYVVRRYLLERDVKGIKHKYPLFGELTPFLTLFTTPDDYIEMGYKDVISMGYSCVKSRVAYLQSRNPVIRRLMLNV